ncbi:MAG TPA: ArgE/DapE family deacylase [Gemmatimonadaceae bacterium]|nr:ArgE/DapE family deacylase [Gemmatimonadaceae bacterium]
MNRFDPLELTQQLVRIDSRNPSLAADGPGEIECARALKAVLDAWGFRTELIEDTPRRASVVARIGGGSGRSIMLNGHIDTVQVDGMTHDPYDPKIADGKMWGRGSCDMKGGVAAMCCAAARANEAGQLNSEVIVTAVADEEWSSIGTRDVLSRGYRADACVVTEPTCMAVAPAHRGFVWVTFTFRGRAAHGSRYDIGIDAIRHAAFLLAELDLLESRELVNITHPLLGHASLHASLIEGGVAMSAYPDRCVLRVERRSLPGETVKGVLGQLERACANVKARYPQFDVTMTMDSERHPSDVPTDAPIVKALSDATAAVSARAPIAGVSYWSDAALLNDAGMPTVCYGPGDIALAHGAIEWIPVEEITRATNILQRFLAAWTRA